MPERDSIPTASETRVSFIRRGEKAQEAVEELKDAGFADDLIAVACTIARRRKLFRRDHFGRRRIFPNCGARLGANTDHRGSRRSRRAALEIINRNHGIAGGART